LGLLGGMFDRVALGVELSIAAFSVELGEQSPSGALHLGPGEVTLRRSSSALAAHFVVGKKGNGLPISIDAILPIRSDEDTLLRIEGGPVTLSGLGIGEGQWGLVEVDRAAVSGRFELKLTPDSDALHFDTEGRATGIAIHESRLAPETLRGLDLAVRARGLVSETQVRLDDFAGRLGSIEVTGAGSVNQETDHVTGELRLALATAPCQSVLDSFPASLLPALQGVQLLGSVAANGEISFDTRELDALRLDYEIQDGCQVSRVPEALSPQHFKQPFSHRIYVPDGSTMEVDAGPGTSTWTPLESISPYMEVAVLVTEDGAFLKHHGFNRSAIRASLIANLKAGRFVRGASTITMQLAKNLFLSRDKTLSRKLEEVALTEYLEQVFSKDELLELYLNVIEFGPGVYGIGPAADYYFGRTPAELNLAECLFLSSILPSPLRYARMRDADQVPDGWMKALRATMQVARRRGLISDAELTESQAEPIVFWHGGPRPERRPAVAPRARVNQAGAADDIPLPALAP
jgi:hypothetical protein